MQQLHLLLALLSISSAAAGGFNFDDIFGPKFKSLHLESSSSKHSSLEQSGSDVQRSSSSSEWKRGHNLSRGGKLDKVNFAKTSSSDSSSSHTATKAQQSGDEMQRRRELVRDGRGRVLMKSDTGSANSFNNKGSSFNASQSESSDSKQVGGKVSVQLPRKPGRLREPCYAQIKATLTFIVHTGDTNRQLYKSISAVETYLRVIRSTHIRVSVVFFNSRVVAALDSGSDNSLQSLRSGLARLTYALRDKLAREFNLANAIEAATRLLRHHLGDHGVGGERAAVVYVADAGVLVDRHEARAAKYAAADEAADTFAAASALLLGEEGEGEREHLEQYQGKYSFMMHRDGVEAGQLLHQITGGNVAQFSVAALKGLAQKLCRLQHNRKGHSFSARHTLF